MNKSIIMGRITRDIELKYTSGHEPIAVTQFNIAVDRPKRGDDKATDFIPVTVWGKMAENCDKYLAKGSRVLVEGRIQIDIKEDDYGNKKSYTKVVANNVEFIDFAGKNDSAVTQRATEQSHDDIPDNFQQVDEDVPFN